MMAGQAADLDRAWLWAHEVEFQEVVKVDQMSWPGDPHVEHRAEALAAGEQLRTVPKLAQ